MKCWAYYFVERAGSTYCAFQHIFLHEKRFPTHLSINSYVAFEPSQKITATAAPVCVD